MRFHSKNEQPFVSNSKLMEKVKFLKKECYDSKNF